MTDEKPLLPSLEGHPADDWHLRKSLRTLAEFSPDPDFKAMVADVLGGKSSLRDVVDSTTFTRTIAPMVESAVADAPQISDAERESLAQQAHAQIEAEYAAAMTEQSSSPLSGDDSGEFYEELEDSAGDDSSGAEFYEELEDSPADTADEVYYEELHETDGSDDDRPRGSALGTAW
ncbi:hypothetical protein AAFP35_00645 [Gordonia sp. CPCC 206044]|uniref:hypothetical protein n=1 Tax=Gordonia sp. CPCC 206044 TaxID=3140793 RepID=UPI003AF4092F